MDNMEADYIRRWRHKGNSGYIYSLNHCVTDKGTDLCIYDVGDKFITSNTYDIGGTYSTEDEPEFWFYYTTSMCHGHNYLLNLFVLPRKPSNFSITVPRPNKLSREVTSNEEKLAIAYGPQAKLTFKTTQRDEHIYVTTFRFDSDNVKSLDKATLLIPILIQTHSKLQLDQDIVRTIKLRHDLNTLMLQPETKDFTLVSSSGQHYPVHKILVAAHSPVLRLKLHNSENVLVLNVNDAAMKIFLEFLYTGSVSNLEKYSSMMLLELAESLQLEQLFSLAQQLLVKEINVNNAASIAVMAKKFKLHNLSIQVFDFIKLHPDVMKTTGWQNLDDVELVKELLKYLHPSGSTDD